MAAMPIEALVAGKIARRRCFLRIEPAQKELITDKCPAKEHARGQFLGDDIMMQVPGERQMQAFRMKMRRC